MANPMPSAAQRLVEPKTGVITSPWQQWLAGLPTDTANSLVWFDVDSGVGFKNSWVNFGFNFAKAAYALDDFGVVHLRGVVANGTVNATIFTLPSGFFPLAKEIFVIDNNALHGNVTVDTSGNVILSTGNNVKASLCGLTFGTT